MATGKRLTFVDLFRVLGAGEQGPAEFDMVSKKCLAQGDSWFSIGALPPGLTSNILAQLTLAQSVAVVNCARPSKELAHMTDTSSEPMFRRLFAGKLAMRWDAILFSGGGNDLIDAASVGPGAAPNLRLLATPDERGAGVAGNGDQYISEPGWATFAQHIGDVFNGLIDLRDSGINEHVPLVLHTYAHIMPRPAPAGPLLGPWLQPAMLAFAVPATDWLNVSEALINRLAVLLQKLIAARAQADPGCELHLVDSRGIALDLGDQTATGVSGDFQNEIHPTRGGYTKLADAWSPVLDAILA